MFNILKRFLHLVLFCAHKMEFGIKCILFCLFSLVMKELVYPWCLTLVDLLLALGDSSPETSALVAESLCTAALHGNVPLLSVLRERLWTLFCECYRYLISKTVKRVFQIHNHL